jgi:cleavage stimulation factor subunit 1
VRWAPNGGTFASAGSDGSIKLWDGVNNRVVNSINSAHSGAPVTTVQFSLNGKYLLSSGWDSTVRLWEIASGRQVQIFTGMALTGARKKPAQAIFSPCGQFVLCCDESSNDVLVYDAVSGAQLKRLSGHNQPVHYLAASPAEPSFFSCSYDHRARFWGASALS